MKEPLLNLITRIFLILVTKVLLRSLFSYTISSYRISSIYLFYKLELSSTRKCFISIYLSLSRTS
jgi:hypothetical protein